MKRINAVQGSPEWHAARANCRGSSEAAAMLGLDKRTSRNDLLKQKALGTAKEFSAWEQEHLLEAGHGAEAAARNLFAEEIGEDLFQVVATDDAGYLIASSDGINMDETLAFEHKLWNAELAASVREGVVPDSHWPQLEQQILVLGVERVIFMVSDGTREKRVWLEYRSFPERRARLIAGWAQFEEDLKAYQHVETAPAVAGTAIATLPQLLVEIVGEVKSSNVAAYKDTALQLIAAIPTALNTDQDFANAERAVKWCGDAEDELDRVKKRALAQTASIADLFDVIDELRDALREKRLALDKLVKVRKDGIRAEILREGQDKLRAHVQSLNTRIGKPYMPEVPADFAGAMKGKRTIESLRNAVDTTLANAKIAANEIADRIQMNLAAINTLAPGYVFLFADAATVCLKAADDFATLVKSRMTEHLAAEQKKADELREKISAGIRAEEAAKAAAAEQKKAAELHQQEEAAKLVTQRPPLEVAAAAGAPARVSQPAPASASPPRDYTGHPGLVVSPVGLDRMRADLMTLAMYLYGTPRNLLPGDVLDVLDRWAPACEERIAAHTEIAA